jgi:hypothetical protein
MGDYRALVFLITSIKVNKTERRRMSTHKLEGSNIIKTTNKLNL